MKPTKEMLAEYKAIAKASDRNMESSIRAHLAGNCPKFAGHEDKFKECIAYVTECAKEILDYKSGEVADDACYKMARDFFNDELWEKDARAAERKKLVAEAETARVQLDGANKNLDDAKKGLSSVKKKAKGAFRALAKFDEDEMRGTLEMPARAPETEPEPEPAQGQCSLFEIAGFANA